MKKQYSHYIILISLLLLLVFQILMLYRISVPIKDNSFLTGQDFSVLYYLKYTSSYILFLIFGLIGLVSILLKKRVGVFFAILYVLDQLINNLYVIKGDWIYFTQWGLFIVFFSSLFTQNFFTFYGLSKKTLTNYFYIGLLVLSVRNIPILFSYLGA